MSAAAERSPAKPVAKTILVVEDERVVARDIQCSLADLGYSVPATAASADQAILLATEHRPDLVLMDIRIKGQSDGIETASLLRKQFDVPIVYLTAYADGPTVERAKLTEPFGYLLKPVKVNELRSAVEIALFKHAMEKQLRERERWLATTMRSIGDAIVSTDPAGRVTYMNPVAERLTGWNAAAALGRPSEDILHLLDERTGAPPLPPLRRALREGRTVRIDAVLVHADGPKRFISDSTAPILDETGDVVGAVMVFRDVTEQREMQRQLEVSERLATVGTMAAGIAHEVNNPLTFILANLGMARTELQAHRTAAPAGDDASWMDELSSGLADAELGATRVGKIVRDLMDFTRATPESTERVSLSDVLDFSLGVAGHALLPRTRVTRHFGDAPRVDASAARLGQVFVNLLINAAHALDSSRREVNEVMVTVRTDHRGWAVAEIRDNGCGMMPELMDRVFDPFVTTKPVGQGTGLGLSVCHGIISSLGGSIVFESTPDVGTLVRVSLPAAAPLAVDPARSGAVAAPPGYLLVVDDEATVRGSIRRALSDDHGVTTAKTSEDALALFTAGMRFDLILCGTSMPDRGGLDLYQEILRLEPEQARRMVFVTGVRVTPRTVDFLCSVANHRIGEPCDPREVRQVVQGLLADLGPWAKAGPARPCPGEDAPRSDSTSPVAS